MSTKIYPVLEKQAVDDDEDWVAYQYEYDPAYDQLNTTIKQDGFKPRSAREWFELGGLPDYATVRAECNRRRADGPATDRLGALLGYINDRTAYDPIIIVDNIDHLLNEVQQRCAEALVGHFTAPGSRVRGAIAVRQENRDAIQQTLDNALLSPEVSLGPLTLTHQRLETPSVWLMLDFIERRLAILRDTKVINMILRSIPLDVAEALATSTDLAAAQTRTARRPSSRSVEAFFFILLELMSVMLCNAFGTAPRARSGDDNVDFITAVHNWHNGSLRECASSLTTLASDILLNNTHTTELQPLMRRVVETRHVPRYGAMHRISRSVLYRHLIFWGGRDGKPPQNVMLFDGAEESGAPPIHFLRMRTLQYLAHRPNARESVETVRRHLQFLDVAESRVDEVLRDLATERIPEDSGLIRVDGLVQSGSGPLRADALVQLLDAGKYLVKDLYVKTEYLFWSAMNTRETRASVGITGDLSPAEYRDEVIRTTIAARFVEQYLVPRFMSEHPYLAGVTEEWSREAARKRLLLYKRLFGFERRRWFLSACCASMTGFIKKHERPADFAEARKAIRSVQRYAANLDELAEEPRMA